jgi:predicted lipid-binding transport protein (Tim44 family)
MSSRTLAAPPRWQRRSAGARQPVALPTHRHAGRALGPLMTGALALAGIDGSVVEAPR